ncbi:hypothetical protein Moror_17258 [Moniliophthora roreri MCA 2997]|uniref:Uncharacterized protein n=2 Tax=Moniliophthora roreri TaxID=221103 RepID=V2Z1J9_MONRO|nr:hypothetical protein Moror_17258 [Moniliophthora roreri MCA 2997]KAI3602569.1 hypothetical protein WG66_009314 [Moniliophthora roreri]
MEGIHPNIMKLEVDVTSDESAKNATTICGRLDILISNAGFLGIVYYGLIRLVNETTTHGQTLVSLSPLDLFLGNWEHYSLAFTIRVRLSRMPTPRYLQWNARRVYVTLVPPINIANYARYDMPYTSVYQDY